MAHNVLIQNSQPDVPRRVHRNIPLLPNICTGLLRELHARGRQRPEYQRLLEECQALYCAARQQLVAPFLQQRLNHELGGLALLPLTRAGCEQVPCA